MSEAILAQAIRSFLESDSTPVCRLSGFADKHLQQALGAFHKRPQKHWTGEALALAAGISRTSFAVTFQKKMTMTPMNYVTAWRMEIAKQALRDPAMTLSDVAESAGYASDSAFARMFKKETGLTPAGFKKTKLMESAHV